MTKEKEEKTKRGSGILLHITSLPSAYGIGDFGEGAYRFADLLAANKQKFWQILPLNPTCGYLGHSPYASFSAFAGNCLLISPDFLVRDGFLSKSDIDNHPPFPSDRVDYVAVSEYKTRILRLAFQKYQDKIEKDKDFKKFHAQNADWLDNYSFFIALKEHFNNVLWSDWPTELRDRKKNVLDGWKEKLRDRILMENFFQYVFFKQWDALKSYCNSKNIKVIGDIPIYISYDSCDVWVNPQIFTLDKERKPTFVAGVPPDYFSSTGQLWGNPVYRWDVLKKNNFAWWVRRFGHNLKQFDIIRLDHFRGFVAFWKVPASEKTAVKGEWVKVPAKEFFLKLHKRFVSFPIIAEDLGHITKDVKEIMRQFNFPGMKLLLFAFDDNPAKNPYIPHNHIQNCIVYTGTHDNNTVKGWFEKDARQEDRNRIFRYLGREISAQDISREFAKIAMMSVADTVILPLQDILGLGEEGRMNRPGTIDNNWQWRALPDSFNSPFISRLKEMTEIYGRA